MFRPFATEPRLSNPYPSSSELVAALARAPRSAGEAVARLWLTEGGPAAFIGSPAIYEDLRGWLAFRLDVHAKEVTLIGSARIGYSLAPPPDFGRPFSHESDLDLSIVSSDLFGRATGEFLNFSAEYRAKAVVPRTPRERELWDANVAFGTRNTPRGFVDPHKVPNFARYPVARLVSQTMWLLVKRLDSTEGAPRVRRASLRVYRDWSSFITRISFNLMCAVRAAA